LWLAINFLVINLIERAATSGLADLGNHGILQSISKRHTLGHLGFHLQELHLFVKSLFSGP
jgi:hypothetical protein